VKPFCFLLPVFLLLVACGGSQKTLIVKQLHLRSEASAVGEDQMANMERQRRLHGAISAADRSERLGQYYTLFWKDPAGTGKGEVEVIFQFQQASSASAVKQMQKKFASSDSSGSVEFAVLGKDYFTHGKVLTWKATLLRDKQIIATRQSYLWR
jgi:uncharacterized protein YcfL